MTTIEILFEMEKIVLLMESWIDYLQQTMEIDCEVSHLVMRKWETE